MEESVSHLLGNLYLNFLCDDQRFRSLDRCDAYYANTQYNHLKYDWNGFWDGYADSADIAPGWYVPLKRRKPSVRVRMAKMVVNKFTAMLLGEDRFPAFNIVGDEDAEDYTRGLIQASKFQIKLAEARDKGGTCGTAVMSFAFLDGKPRLDVHRAKHIRVLQWKDRHEFRPSVVLKTYRYTRNELENGKPKDVTYYYARLWTENTETIWDPIPEEKAKSGRWVVEVKRYTVTHNYGDCPVYWAQNLPDSDNEDGDSDFDGLQDDFDEINRLVSATTKGTIANVDPTLVIKDDPQTNTGTIKKGSENAIYSKGGAEYLELNGASIETSMNLARSLIEYACEVAGVVLTDPNKISGAAKSAAAMRLIYQPMTNQCDKLRAQYGEGLATPLLVGMLRAARKAQGTAGEIFVTSDGRRIQNKPVIILPPLITKKVEYEVDTETGMNIGEPVETVETKERKPGTSEQIDLKWPPYFQPTQPDVLAAVDAATKARGTLVSDRTATKFVSNMFGIQDVDSELSEMKQNNEDRAAMMEGMEDEGEFGDSKNKDEPDDSEGA